MHRVVLDFFLHLFQHLLFKQKQLPPEPLKRAQRACFYLDKKPAQYMKASGRDAFHFSTNKQMPI